jgi:hypothetical protein
MTWISSAENPSDRRKFAVNSPRTPMLGERFKTARQNRVTLDESVRIDS